jgi:hypothetical protein
MGGRGREGGREREAESGCSGMGSLARRGVIIRDMRERERGREREKERERERERQSLPGSHNQ